MNPALDRLANQFSLSAPEHERLRLAFGAACAERVRHLLEQPDVAACLDGLSAYLTGSIDRARLQRLAARAGSLASAHQGSRSIDGCGHAAVSATYAVARALAAKAIDAAAYAAYAAVYAQGGYAAVADPESFAAEFAWQCEQLAALAEPASLA
jgi:hypothetical protein